MKKIEQVKINHHYVWARYLKNWASGKNVYYISKNGKIAFDSVKGLARKQHFYKLPILTEEDIDFVNQFVSQFDEFLREQALSTLADLFNVSKLINNLRPLQNENSKEFQKLVDIIESNLIENMHSIDESLFLPVLERLSLGDITCLEDTENLICFCLYLGHQFTRTLKIRNTILADEPATEEIRSKFPREQYLLERNWPCLSFVLGSNIGFNLFAKRNDMKWIFLTNHTDVSFITSDQPAINIHPSVKVEKLDQPPEDMDIYFPISPKYALMLNESRNYDDLEKNLAAKDVMYLNYRIYKDSGETVFSNSRESLASAFTNLRADT